jgi:hypothetical protein
MAPSGIELAAFRVVAQYLNHLQYQTYYYADITPAAIFVCNSLEE